MNKKIHAQNRRRDCLSLYVGEKLSLQFIVAARGKTTLRSSCIPQETVLLTKCKTEDGEKIDHMWVKKSSFDGGKVPKVGARVFAEAEPYIYTTNTRRINAKFSIKNIRVLKVS